MESINIRTTPKILDFAITWALIFSCNQHYLQTSSCLAILTNYWIFCREISKCEKICVLQIMLTWTVALLRTVFHNVENILKNIIKSNLFIRCAGRLHLLVSAFIVMSIFHQHTQFFENLEFYLYLWKLRTAFEICKILTEIFFSAYSEV